MISRIARVFQKLLKYFDGIGIPTFAGLIPSVLFKNLDLNLNELESVLLSSRPFVQYCHELFFVVIKFLNNFCYILLNYTSALQHQHYDLFVLYLFLLCSR